MNVIAWYDNLIVTLEIFANPDLQYEYWVVGNDNVFSSFEEEMCSLFDDCFVKEAIKFHVKDLHLTPEIIHSLEGLIVKLESFDNDFSSDEELIKSEDWKEIVVKAKSAFKALSLYRVQKL